MIAPDHTNCSKTESLGLVLLFSGICGFWMGILGHATWHQAVEGAQVLAGIVKYPFPTPFYTYEIKAWTLLHQLPALFLYGGVSEIHLSLAISGIVGMMAYQAMAIGSYAILPHKWSALFIPFFIDYLNAAAFESRYPVFLMGCIATYGMFGLLYGALTLGFLSHQKYRLGGFLLGLAPAFHISIGVMLWGMIGIYGILLNKNIFQKIFRAFLVGVLLALGSYLVHRMLIPYPVMTESFDTQQLVAFIRAWDSHRLAIDLENSGLWINAVSIALASAILKFSRHSLRPELSLLLYISWISGILGLMAAAVSLLPQERVPFLILSSMPIRILNFNILFYPVILFSVLFSSKTPFLRGLYYLSLIAFPLFRHFHPSGVYYGLVSAGLLVCVAVIFPGKDCILQTRRDGLLQRFLSVLSMLVFLYIPFKMLFLASQKSKNYEEVYQDWSNDPFFKKVREGTGLLLLSPDLSTYQLLTRRPVLLDCGALDMISYFPELGPATLRISKDIYGIDLFNPPPDAAGVAILPEGSSRKVWEERTADEWKKLKKDYGFEQILTPAWKLVLPVAAENSTYSLYQIPD